MINYHVRSRDLVDVVNDINSGKIILSPYFQRKLVWREGHKVDFIKTILLGFPFPEIFIARGTLNVETMQSTSCIVDGQQRMNSIREYIGNKFEVDGKTFSQLTPKEKESFLKYEIAIIDLDLSNDDPIVIEIFRRLNRTFYALSNIEKMATEFASSEFMLVAKLLCGELQDEAQLHISNVDPDLQTEDPNVSADFTMWANSQKISSFLNLMLRTTLFSKYEISRKVHLMYTLNLMSTAIAGSYNRNDKVKEHLESYAQSFDMRGTIVARLNNAASYFSRLKLKPTAFWHSKSTSFSLLQVIDEQRQQLNQLDMEAVRERLDTFAAAPPTEYISAGKEAVNNKRERLLRHDILNAVFLGTPAQKNG